MLPDVQCGDGRRELLVWLRARQHYQKCMMRSEQDLLAHSAVQRINDMMIARHNALAPAGAGCGAVHRRGIATTRVIWMMPRSAEYIIATNRHAAVTTL